MAAKTETKLTLELMCPRCGGSGNDPADGVIGLDLNDMTGTLTCGECSNEFTVLQAIEVFSVQMRRWQIVERMINFAVKAIETANQDDTAF